MTSTITKFFRSIAVSAVVCMVLLLPKFADAALSGTYTINPSAAASATNYKTFASAVSDLQSGTRADGGTANGSGVSGAVVFNIANGTYSEQVSIPSITGASAIRTITFQSASGDSSKVILTSAAGSGSDYTLDLNSANYIIIKKISIRRTGTGSPSKVVTLGSSSNNQFLNNQIIGVKQMSDASGLWSTADNASIHQTGGDSNLYRNNHIIYGLHGIFLTGTSAGNKIISNLFDTSGSAAIWGTSQSKLLIEQNLARLGTITIPSSTVQHYVSYGVRLENSSDFKILRNKFYLNSAATTARAIVFFTITGSSSKPSLIANNWIRNEAGSSSSTGLSLAAVEYLNVYYNTIYNSKSLSTGSAFHVYAGYAAGTDINLVNNNFIHKGGGYAFDIADISGIKTSDYNNIYTTGTNIGIVNSNTYTTFALLKAGTKKDANSISIDPMFVSNTDLKPTNPNLKGMGTPITGITTDIDNNPRKSKFPDIGANEFPLVATDASISAISTPSTVCEGNNNIILTIKNYGTDTLQFADIAYSVNDTSTGSFAWKGKLATDSSAVVNVGAFNFKVIGNNKFKAWPRNPNANKDLFTFNDTLRTNIRVLGTPKAGTGGNKSVCLGESVKIGSPAVGGSTYSWTSKPAGFTSGVADPTVSPTVTTTYYLTEKSALCSGSDSVVVTVTPKPNAETSADRTICVGESTILGAAPVTGNSYSWYSVPAGFTSTLANPQVTPHPLVKTTRYVLTETVDATGCTKSDTVIIQTTPVPSANTGGENKTICSGQSTQIGAAAVTGNTYSWTSIPAGFTSTVSNPTVDPVTTTTYYLTEKITATGCTKTNSITVTVNPLPGAFVGANRNSCSGQPVALGTISVPGRTYSWISKPAGFTSTVSNPTVSPNVTTTYYLTETNTTTKCSKTDSVKITVSPSPAANTGADRDLCPGASTQLGAAAVSGNSYSWKSVPAGFTSSSSNPTVSPSVTTIYILTEKIGAAGCSKTDSVTVKVLGAPVGTITGQTTVCSGSTTTHSVTKTAGTTYNWIITGGTITSGQTTESITVKWIAAGSGAVKVVSSSATGCKDSVSVALTVRQGSSTKWTAAKIADKTFRFTPEDTTLTSYAWDFGDGGTSTDMKPTHAFATSGNFNIKLTVNSSNGCVVTGDSTFSTTVGILEANIAANNISIYPNPFKETTTLAYTLTEKARVKIQVYDIAGKEIANIADATQIPGNYKYNFNASQYNAGSGIYIVKMVIGDKFVTRQIVNLK